MCVLTYVPFADNHFVLTNNRDEATIRPKAISPQEYMLFGKKVTFPKDPQAGGTWIATSLDYSLCLLNGDTVKHISNPPYLKSRGQVILDFFEYSDVKQFIETYDFEGIENFTLLIFQHQPITQIHQLRYNGQRLSYEQKDPQKPHMWSSATLYSSEVIQQRNIWFTNFLTNFKTTPENLIDFHRNGGDGNPDNDLQVNRNEVLKTHCITQVIKKETTKMEFLALF